MTPVELQRALVDAFEPRPIARDALEDPASRWQNYDRADAMLGSVGNRPWTALDREFIEAFPEGLIFAGPASFRLLLPAYLSYLLELDGFGEALYPVANQLTRKDDAVDQRIFDARVGALDKAQRAVVALVIEHLAARPAMERVMAVAQSSWN